MKNRKSRLSTIIDILSCHNIGSQEELLERLTAEGFSITQATLSRDLRKLRATKIAVDGNGYRYVILDPFAADDTDRQTSSELSFGHSNEKLNQDVLSFSISRNLVVIKTRNGCASGMAYDIDMLKIPEILGTIPGTDTVLLVVDERLQREQIMRLLMDLIPDAIMSQPIKG